MTTESSIHDPYSWWPSDSLAGIYAVHLKAASFAEGLLLYFTITATDSGGLFIIRALDLWNFLKTYPETCSVASSASKMAKCTEDERSDIRAAISQVSLTPQPGPYSYKIYRALGLLRLEHC